MIEIISFYSVLLIVSTLLSMSEVSLLTISDRKLKELIRYKLHFEFFERKRNEVAMDLMSINFIWDYLGAMILSYLITKEFGENVVWVLIFSFGTALITLKVATLAAKMIASKKPESVLKKLGRGLKFFYYLLKPLAFILSADVMLFLRSFLKKHDKEDKLTDTELLSILSMAKKEGIIEDKPHELILNLIEIQDKTVSELMLDNKFECIDIEGDILSLKDKIISGELRNKYVVVTKTHENGLYPLGIIPFTDIAKTHMVYACDKKVDIPSIAKIMHPCVITKHDEKASLLISELDKEDHVVVVTNDDGTMMGVLESDDIIRTAMSNKSDA